MTGLGAYKAGGDKLDGNGTTTDNVTDDSDWHGEHNLTTHSPTEQITGQGAYKAGGDKLGGCGIRADNVSDVSD